MSADDLLVPHLVTALTQHSGWCRSRGLPFPVALRALLNALAASNGQERTSFGDQLDAVEPDPVTPMLLADPAVALRLGISERSVRRLRLGGAWPTVMVGRRRLTRLADIEKFVENGGSC